jgi:circadian clock protein KaiB
MKRSKAQDSTRAFEEALAATRPAAHYCLRLFITGTTPKSARAVTNIRALCEANLAGRYDLEVIDIYQHPEQAQPEQIMVTPTLIRKLPLPFRRIIGDLSNNEKVLAGLDIVRRPDSVVSPKNEHAV